MHVADLGGHEPGVVHLHDRRVGGRTPDAGVRRHAQTELAGRFEGTALGELRCAGHVEGELQAQHVVRGVEVLGHEGSELGCVRPLPRSTEVVAIPQHEPAGDLTERLKRRLAVLGRAKAVRPVERRRHTGVDRLEGREEIARVDVFGAEDLSPLQVVEDEVLGERPVPAVPAQRRLPHVAMRVDEARGEDAAGGIDLESAFRHLELLADGLDPVADNEHVGALEDARGVDRDHRGVPEGERGARR